MTAKPPTEHSAQEIADWMTRNSLTQMAAAEALGVSRRMLVYYLSGEKPVPRTVALACLGWEVEQTKSGALKRPASWPWPA